MLHACFSFYIAPAIADMSDFIEYLHEVFAGFGEITTRRNLGAKCLRRRLACARGQGPPRQRAAVAQNLSLLKLDAATSSSDGIDGPFLAKH